MIKNKFKQIIFTVFLSMVAVFTFVNVSEATCIHTYTSATCDTAKTCTKCGATLGTPLGHQIEKINGVIQCKECGKIFSTSDDGNNNGNCSDNNNNNNNNNPDPAPHIHKYVDATCTEPKKCSCGATLGNALGHDFVITEKIEASCIATGKITYTCDRCEISKVEIVSTTGHNYEITENIEATCTSSGRIEKTCSVCGNVKTTVTGPTGHDFVVTETDATCTVPGRIVKKCNICGYKTTVEGQALGHDFKETLNIKPTCTESGKIVLTCQRCEEEKVTIVPTLEHDAIMTYNATYHWHKCSVCGEQIDSKELHTFSSNVCKICGYKKTADIEDPDDDVENGLIVEPWMKENDELDCLAVSLRSEPYEEDRANKNIYALNEKIVYYVDYKNGGKSTSKDVVLKLELPLSFLVVNSDGASVSKTNKTLTWTFKGMDKEEAGTKVVVIKYTSLGSSSAKSKVVVPSATISLEKTKKDVSSVLNLVVKDFDIELNDEHDPYMYGDKDTKTFRPDDTITRAEGALVLVRTLGISTRYDDNLYNFPDLNETYLEARRAIKAATACGLIQGFPDGTYKPNRTMTRGEFITILARQIEEEREEGFEIKEIDELIKVYKDKNKYYFVSESEYYDEHWSVPYATLLARLNMTSLTEKSTNLRLDDPITRAEVAQLMNFFLLRAPARVSTSTRIQFPDVSKKHKLFADIVEATRATHKYSITEEGTEEKE